MKSNYEKVVEFHRVFGLDYNLIPTVPDESTIKLQMSLIEEELEELKDEVESKGEEFSMSKTAKELTDLLYVVYGLGARYGVPVDKVFAEVHDSNMSKLVDGKPIRNDDGKVLKGENYFKADVEKVIREFQENYE